MPVPDPTRTESSWRDCIERRVECWLEFELGPDWVVAVSGGSDSVGLLHVLHAMASRLGLKLSVAHLDHGVRGEAAEADARFVAKLAAALGLPFDLGRWQPPCSAHFEAEARRARYAWLAEVARKRKASVVAVGHTRDDQAETILHRILRGTGLSGLSGMPEKRPLAAHSTLVRPLLTTSRSQLRHYLAALNQPFREDATNADRSRTRSRIRHDLIPFLEREYNPRICEALLRLSELAGDTSQSIARLLDRRARRAMVEADQAVITLRCDLLKPLPPVLRAELLRRVWQRQGWPELSMDAARWRRLAELVDRFEGQGTVSIGAGREATWGAGVLRLSCAPQTEPDTSQTNEPVMLPVPGSAIWGSGRVVASFDRGQPHEELVDFAALDMASHGAREPEDAHLVIRGPRPGDRFEPLGMEGQTMSLNDFLRGRRVPRAARSHVPLLVDRKGIVWVVGHRIAHRVRLIATSERILSLHWDPEWQRNSP